MNGKPLKIKLTKSAVDNLKPKEKLYRVWDSELAGFHVRVHPSGKKSFYLRYYINRQSNDIHLARYGDCTPAMARKTAQQEKLRSQSQGVDLLEDRKLKRNQEKQKRTESKKLKQASFPTYMEELYLPWARDHLASYKEILRLFKADFMVFRDLQLNQITPREIDKLITSYKKKGLVNSTINRRVGCVKSALSKAVEWGVIENSPLRGMKRLKVDKQGRVRFLRDDERGRLIDALETRQEEQRVKRASYIRWSEARAKSQPQALEGRFTDYLYPMVILALNTGLRRGELFKLVWSDIDFDLAILSVKGEGAKSYQTRHIPLNKTAIATLSDWALSSSKSGLVFPSPRTGRQLDNIYSSWNNLMKTAQIDDFNFHDLRHTAITLWIHAGHNIKVVQEMAGHEDVDTTMRYVHLLGGSVESVGKNYFLEESTDLSNLFPSRSFKTA